MNGLVYALAVSGTDLYAGGKFTTAGGTVANQHCQMGREARGRPWARGWAERYMTSMRWRSSGTNLYAGGEFTTAGGKVSAYIAQANLTTSPPVPLHLQNCRLAPVSSPATWMGKPDASSCSRPAAISNIG